MTSPRLRAVPVLCALWGASLHAADFSTYRGLHFGMTLTAAARQVGARPAEARFLHQRPALIQEIDWQPRPPVQADPREQSDPVKDAVLGFYNGELFRIAVTYHRDKVEGMSANDMVEVLSAAYGPATRPAAQIAYHSNYGETGEVLARWEDGRHSYNLLRTGDRSSFALLLYSKRLDALAQAAIIQSVRLDSLEAPRLDLEKQARQATEDRLALDKARSVNKPNFRP